jgi:xylose dehydrogenase (NAD/NADP)
METGKMRWGVLGAANIAKRSVIPGIQASKTGVVVAIASRDIERARAMADMFGVSRCYSDYDALLADEAIDAVYIPLPNHLHRLWTIRAAQAKKHVLCEKPAALNAAETMEMVEACQAEGVSFAEAFMYRHHPRYDRIRAIVDSGEIGELRGMHATFTFNNAKDHANIRYQREMGGGSLYDVGCYPISVARWVFRTEPVAATVSAWFSPQHDEVDMMASGLLEFPEGQALTFDCGMWAYGRQGLEILGTAGRIEVPYPFLGDADFSVWRGSERRVETFEGQNPYSLQADDFCASARGERPPRVDSHDAVRNMAALDACLTSAREHRRVSVEP